MDFISPLRLAVFSSHCFLSFQAGTKFPSREQLQYMTEQQQQQQQFKLLQQQAEQYQMRKLRKLQQQKLYQQQLLKQQQRNQEYPLHRYGDPKEPGAGRYNSPPAAEAGQNGDEQESTAGQYRGMDYESGQLTSNYEDGASPEAEGFVADYNGAGPDDDAEEEDGDVKQSSPASRPSSARQNYLQQQQRQLPPTANGGGNFEARRPSGGNGQYFSGKPGRGREDPYRLTYRQQQQQLQRQQQQQRQQQLGVYPGMQENSDYSEGGEEESFGEFRLAHLSYF